ncbi:MAG: response regulator, partial [Magnetococcales bacterium]|nr:response regulator [Magnetococcales bacterium]
MSAKAFTLLIVDDERHNITVLGELLREEYNLMVAKNGKQALKLISSGKMPDLVLLDIMMPEMDGYEVCRNLKEDPVTRKIPVIFISAMSSEEDESKGFEVGGVDYVIKPFRPIVIKARIQTHLELKAHRDTLEQLSTLDGLTGINNRRKFDTFLSREWDSARRTGQPLSIILSDIDFFKQYNDNYGHTQGDTCLQQVGR